MFYDNNGIYFSPKKTSLFVCLYHFIFIIDWTSIVHASTASLVSALRLTFSLAVLSVSPAFYSVHVYKGRVILRPASNCNRPQTGAQRREGGDSVVRWGFFSPPFLLHMCVCWESSCVGVAGWFLRSLSPVQECMLGCPGLTLPPCMCVSVYICVSVCVFAVCVSKSLVAESSLNKGSFWIGFQDNQRSCWGWEVLAD